MRRLYLWIILVLISSFINPIINTNSELNNESMNNEIVKLDYPVILNKTIFDFCIKDELLIASIENENKIKIFNNSEPTSIKLLSEMEVENISRIEVQGNLLISGNLRTGDIYIINITNPSKPVILSVYLGEFDYILLSDMLVYGLTLFCTSFSKINILNISDPTNIQKISTYQSTQLSSPKLYASGNLLFRYGDENGVEIIDITQLTNPKLLTIIDKTEYSERTKSILMKDNYLLTVPYAEAQIKVYDMKNASKPELIARGDLIGHFSTIASWKENLYVVDFGKIYIMNITDPKKITTEHIITDTAWILSLLADDSYLYCVYYSSYGVIPLNNSIPYEGPFNPPPTTPPSSINPQPSINLETPAIIIGVIAPALLIIFIQKIKKTHRN